VIGPGLGGALVSALGAPFAVLIDAASFVASAIFVGWIRVAEAAPAAMVRRAGVLAEIGEGLRTVVTHPLLRVLAGCSATTNLFGYMFMAVYVLYMTRDLGLGPVGVGLVFATGGLGALTGALVASPTARRLGPGPALIWAQVVFGLTGLLVPLAVLVPEIALPMVVGSEFAQWLGLTAYYVTNVSVRQSITPDRLLGRVNATVRFLAGGALPIGSVLGGALGGLIGLPMTLVVAQFGLLLAVVWLLLSPLRMLRQLPPPPHGDEAGGALERIAAVR
jgi:MFS family permease